MKQIEVDEHTFQKIIKRKAMGVFLKRPFSAMAVSILYLLPISIFGVIIQQLYIIKSVSDLELLLSVLGLLCLFIVVSAPMTIGKYRYFLLETLSKKPKIIDCLMFFTEGRLWFRSIKVYFLVQFKAFLWACLLFLPAGLYGAYLFGLPAISFQQGQMVLAMSLLGLFFTFAIRQKYMGAFILIAADPDIKAWTALKSSVYVYRKKTMFLVRFYFSFIPWIFLSAITGGIGEIVYDPYYTTAFIYLFSSTNVHSTRQEEGDKALGDSPLRLSDLPGHEDAGGDDEEIL